jgi:hypothetical protein
MTILNAIFEWEQSFMDRPAPYQPIDNKEKTEQVNLMRLINHSCSQCLAWLGEIEEEGKFTLQGVKAAFNLIDPMQGQMIQMELYRVLLQLLRRWEELGLLLKA